MKIVTLLIMLMICAVWAADAGAGVFADTAAANANVNADTMSTVQADSTGADTSAGALIGAILTEAAIDSLGMGDMENDSAEAVEKKANLNDVDDLDLAALMIDDANTAASQQKMNLVRREYTYSRQIRLSIVMMCFIAVLLATSQSMNPR